MVGFNAFNPSYLVKFPESVFSSLLGDVAGPLINKSQIKAQYFTANAKQFQAVCNYERAVLNGYIQAANQISKIENLQKHLSKKQTRWMPLYVR